MEEAIKVCVREKECVQTTLNSCADGIGYVSPDGMIRASDYVDALDTAISALREQEERSKCEWCDFFFDHSGKFRFCPQCGRRLEEV